MTTVSQDIQAVLSHYMLPAPVIAIQPLTQGLIHETYRIDTASARYVLQKMHPVFSEKVHANVHAAQQHLRTKGVATRETLLTSDQKTFVKHQHHTWRLTTFVAGRVFDMVTDPTMARGAGKILGIFHKSLSDMPDVFEQQRAAVVTITSRLEHFQKVLDEKAMTPEMKAWKDAMLALPAIALPENLRKTVCQGDTKISNIVFKEDSFEPVTMIDLDDVGFATPLIDFGNAMRSWCGMEEDNLHNVFNLEYFTEAYRAYQTASDNFLTPDEQALIPRAVMSITLVLALRFFTDYFEDVYFSFDHKRYRSRREHNLARTRGQMALYLDVQKKQEAMQAIITQG